MADTLFHTKVSTSSVCFALGAHGDQRTTHMCRPYNSQENEEPRFQLGKPGGAQHPPNPEASEAANLQRALILALSADSCLIHAEQ